MAMPQTPEERDLMEEALELWGDDTIVREMLLALADDEDDTTPWSQAYEIAEQTFKQLNPMTESRKNELRFLRDREEGLDLMHRGPLSAKQLRRERELWRELLGESSGK